MIVPSRFAKAGAMILALVAHGTIAVTLSPPEQPRIEGSAGAAEVRLGTSFADMSAGRVAHDPAHTPTEKADPDQMTPAPTRDTTERTAPAEPLQSQTIGPPLKPVAVATAERVKPARLLPAIPPTVAQTAAVVSSPKSAPRKQVAPSPAPDTSQRLTGKAPQHAAVTRSLRPRMRDPERAVASKPITKAATGPKPEQEPKAQPKPPSGGGAERNARAGAPTGNAAAKSRAKGSEGRKATSGNAAASNYPGQVMRKLSRTRRPNVSARGAAVISFTIAAHGGLSSVAVTGSSGSAALDRAALQIVRSAAPFPAPPSGARRSFSIQIKGR